MFPPCETELTRPGIDPRLISGVFGRLFVATKIFILYRISFDKYIFSGYDMWSSMFVESASCKAANGKTYTRVLLRSSERINGKVVHRTLGNLSSCSAEEILAIKAALKHKGALAEALQQLESHSAPAKANGSSTALPADFKQGPSIGAVWMLAELARELGIVAALGNDRPGQLALWQVIARALEQGSRLSAVRLARDLGAGCLLDLGKFDEDDLYANLAWLDARQPEIEQAIFHHRYGQSAPAAQGQSSAQVGPGDCTAPPVSTPSLYLYDVTSTYLEGQCNALGAFGYNRDGKRGKQQIVVGLLCEAEGQPVAIEAFAGNTSDPKTVGRQIEKLRQRFRAENITLVGDRGMIRGPQITALHEAGLHFISAISKPQIETLLAAGTLQMELFDTDLAEVIIEPESESAASPNTAAPAQPVKPAQCGLGRNIERYVLRRNPTRQEEMARSRQSRKHSVEKSLHELNTYLAEHPKARAQTALARLTSRLSKLGLGQWLKAQAEGRTIVLKEDAQALAEESKLDGCYVLRTDLSPSQASKETVHQRYKSLAEVEQAFRRSKTVELEMRPVHVRKEQSTRGHLLVVMLAYILMRELGQRWGHLDLTVKEGLARLNTYCAVEIAGVVQIALKPRAEVEALLAAARVGLPKTLRHPTGKVATKKKLPKNRPKLLK
jgi:hypothetical protein